MAKRFRLLSRLLLITVLFTGCATTVTTTEKIPGSITDYIIPVLGEVSKAHIGEPLVMEWSTLTRDAIFLSSNFGLIRITAHHPKGEYTLIGKQDSMSVYQHGNTYFDGWVTRKSQLLEDSEGTVYRKTYSGTKEVPKAKHTKEQVITDASEPLEQRLIFTGSEGTVLKFTYCEFLEDVVSPAFSLNASYDISVDTIIRFKGLQIEVLAFDNQGITYILHSGFKDKAY